MYLLKISFGKILFFYNRHMKDTKFTLKDYKAIAGELEIDIQKSLLPVAIGWRIKYAAMCEQEPGIPTNTAFERTILMLYFTENRKEILSKISNEARQAVAYIYTKINELYSP